MKASCSTELLSAAGSQDFNSLISLASELGLHGVNIDFGPHSLFTPDMFPFNSCWEYVRFAQALQVEIQCISGVEIGDTVMKHQIEQLRKAICIAHALACPLVVVKLPGTNKMAGKREFRQLIEILRDAVDFAQDFDICLAIEPMADTCIVSMDSTVDLVDEINRLNIGIVYNPAFHELTTGIAPLAAAERFKPYLLMIRLSPDSPAGIVHGQYDEMLNNFATLEFTEYVCNCSFCPPSESESDIASLILENFEYLRGLNILD
jgi:sugar phosphate isomerase/epimerase